MLFVTENYIITAKKKKKNIGSPPLDQIPNFISNQKDTVLSKQMLFYRTLFSSIHSLQACFFLNCVDSDFKKKKHLIGNLLSNHK